MLALWLLETLYLGFVMMMKYKSLLLLASIIMLSCGDDEHRSPAITHLSQNTNLVTLQPIYVYGSNFAESIEDNQVYFDGTLAEIIDVYKDSIRVRVPRSINDGMVTVTAHGMTAEQQLPYFLTTFTCEDAADLQVENFQWRADITESGRLYYAFELTNQGSFDINTYNLTIQNYISDNDTFEDGDTPAGGSAITPHSVNTDTFESGVTYFVSHYTSLKPGSYLIIKIWPKQLDGDICEAQIITLTAQLP